MLDYDMYLEINLAPKLRLITVIATQGNPDNDWWTTKYTIKYKTASKLSWISYNQVNTTMVRIACWNSYNKLLSEWIYILLVSWLVDWLFVGRQVV